MKKRQPNLEYDFESPQFLTHWFSELRIQVEEYIEKENIPCGRIGIEPAWHLSPYISLWAIESATQTDNIGWWIICGDVPTDYVSGTKVHNPQEAVRAIAHKWLELSECIEKGIKHPDIRIDTTQDPSSLAPLLKTRAEILLEWVEQEELWNEDEKIKEETEKKE